MGRLLRALAILGLAICVGAAAATTVHAEKYKIGAILAMTGPGAYYGRVMSRGALLAIDEINAKGGIDGMQLELIIEDHKSGQPKEGVNAINKLVNVDKVPYILTSYSAPTLAAYPIAEEHQVLMLNGGGWSPKLVGKPYLFNNRMVGSYLGQVIVRHAFAQGHRRLAMIYRNDPSGITVRDQVRPFWKKLGGKVVAMEIHELGATDYTAQLAKIKASRPDVLATWSYGKDLGFIVKQARDLGITVPIMGIDWTPDGQNVAGPAMEGYQYATDYLDLQGTEEWTGRFIRAYKKKYNENPDFYAANYYEGVYVLAELIRAVEKQGGNPRSGAALRQALLKIRTFPSVYGGSIAFKKDGTSAKPVAIFEVRNAKPVVKTLVK